MLLENLKNIVYNEYYQKCAEGIVFDDFEKRLEKAIGNKQALDALYDELSAYNTVEKDYKYTEPDDYSKIMQLCNKKDIQLEIDETAVKNKMLGAWQGRVAGCALGKPLETHPFVGGDEKHRAWQWIKLWCEGAGVNYPIDDFVPFNSKLNEENIFLNDWNKCCTKGNISFMASDDDIRYTLLGQQIIDKYGVDFSSWDVGQTWINTLAYRQTFTAEAAAYYNYITLTPWNVSKKPEDWKQSGEKYVATYHNPDRELIGAQIRADGYAYAAAGRPTLAAKLCYEDACISHRKNGIYGEMFFGAMISAAFSESDIEKLVKIALDCIPNTSRLYEAILQTVEIVKLNDDYEAVITEIYNRFGHYSCVHTINNAALCVASLLMSKGDFEKGICYAVSGGWDTDCNGATVGSVLGAIAGAKKLDSKWVLPFNNEIRAEMPCYDSVKISDCADKSYKNFLQIL